MDRRFALKTLLGSATALVLPLTQTASAAATHEVMIKSFKFAPDVLNVNVGDTIVFKNLDGAPHTATARNGSWNTKTLRKNKTAEILVTADMGTSYFCKFHPNMSGKLKIG